MAHAQKPDFVFRRNWLVDLNRRGRQFSRLLAAEMCRSAFIVGSNAGYTMYRGSVKGTGYPLHSLVSPSLPLTCVSVCHHISTGVYLLHIRTDTPTVVWTCMRREKSFTSNVKQSPDLVAQNLVTTLIELSLLRNTERGIRTYSWEQNLFQCLPNVARTGLG